MADKDRQTDRYTTTAHTALAYRRAVKTQNGWMKSGEKRKSGDEIKERNNEGREKTSGEL